MRTMPASSSIQHPVSIPYYCFSFPLNASLTLSSRGHVPRLPGRSGVSGHILRPTMTSPSSPPSGPGSGRSRFWDHPLNINKPTLHLPRQRPSVLLKPLSLRTSSPSLNIIPEYRHPILLLILHIILVSIPNLALPGYRHCIWASGYGSPNGSCQCL